MDPSLTAAPESAPIPAPTPPAAPSYVEDVEIVGHIIDSLILPKVLDEVMALGGRFEIREIRIGQRRNDPSYAQLRVIATTPEHLESLLTAIGRHGAVPIQQQDCRLVPADMDGAFPEGFYATTNQDTQIRLKGSWIQVERQEMDCGIVVDAERGHAACIPMVEVRAGDPIVVGRAGTRVLPTERDTAGRDSFGFMNSSVSSEKPKGITVRDVAAAMQDSRRDGGKILVVAGPAVVHTGSRDYLSHLIRHGFVNVLFAGNALATHDIEQSLFGTSLGISMTHGGSTEEGHQHHLRSINRMRRWGESARPWNRTSSQAA